MRIQPDFSRTLGKRHLVDFVLLKLQDKIDQMSLAKRPTEVRLDPHMVENFKRQVMIAQTLQPK